MRKFNKITIIGVGLIGGSMGLAIKQRRLAGEVVGVGHHKNSVDMAVRLNTIDRGTLDVAEGVKGADLVILATPILSMPPLAKRMAAHLKEGCIVTDVGSTKLSLTRSIEALGDGRINFVGGHPMAGSEKRGVSKANGDLFRNSICILTKTKRTDARSLNILKELWKALGTEVVVISPEAHDRIVSQTSHLPHMVIFSMLESIDKKSLRFASSGFYDTTRIASSDARIWRDIAVSNRGEILRSIGAFKKSLARIEKAIREHDGAALSRIFKKAKAKRELLI